MFYKFTLKEIELLFSSDAGKEMIKVYPKTQTLNFIKQFAYTYHAEKTLPLPLSAMMLN